MSTEDAYKLLNKVSIRQEKYMKSDGVFRQFNKHIYLPLNVYNKLKSLLTNHQKSFIKTLTNAILDVNTRVSKYDVLSISKHNRQKTEMNRQVQYYTVKMVHGEKRIIPHYETTFQNPILEKLRYARKLIYELRTVSNSLGNKYVCLGEYPNIHIMTIKDMKNLIKDNKNNLTI